MMKNILRFVIPILACFLVGLGASYFQSDAIADWYPTLNKPVLTPPNAAFPVVWSILYLCMGVSIGLILVSKRPEKYYFINLFVAQLLFNFTWSIFFFYFQNPLVGFINIVILDALIVVYAYRSYSVCKASSILFIPYAVWVTFAAYLNLYILLYN